MVTIKHNILFVLFEAASFILRVIVNRGGNGFKLLNTTKKVEMTSDESQDHRFMIVQILSLLSRLSVSCYRAIILASGAIS